jgi:transposase, IS5 family
MLSLSANHSNSPLIFRDLLSKEKKSKQQKMKEFAKQFVRKFGQAKRRFSLDRAIVKLDNTSLTAISITFLVMNLVAGLKRLLWLFLVSWTYSASPN